MKRLFLSNMSYFATIALLTLSVSEAAHADKMYGLFMVVKGAVQVQSGGGAAADVKVGSKIFEGDTVISGPDSRAKIVMADRNTININPDTKLQIQKYTNDAASGQKAVQLNLIEGKVRNNVEQTYDGKKSTFQIKTPTAVAGVRGTQFLASFDRATQATNVVTFKGSVTLASVNPAGLVVGKPVVVAKGQTSQTAPNQPAATPAPMPKDAIKKLDSESSVSLKKTTGDSSTASNSGTKGSASSSSSSSGSSDRGPAAAGGPSLSGGGSMIDSRDMDVGLAKGISAGSAVATGPTAMDLMLAQPAQALPSNLVQGVLNNTAGKTTLVVTPSPR